MSDLLKYENQFIAEGKKLIAGIDEAGRGPLAGPVVVAGVVMPLDSIISGVYDSKKVPLKKREILYEIISSNAIDIHIEIIGPEVIDRINILNATKQGMKKCVDSLNCDIAIIDAVKISSDRDTFSLIKGDQLSYSVAAASIIAKVTRDRLMQQMAALYPEYLFENHKGYGTALHYERIYKYGLCDIHRRSFCKKVIDNLL